MIRIVPVFRVLGGLLIGLAIMMTPGFLLDHFSQTRDATYFLVAIVLSLFAGLTLIVLTASRDELELNRRQAFMITGLAWTILPGFGAIPFLGVEGVTYAGAYFETVSGLTTTGATVIVGLDDKPQGVLLWRALTTLIGGIGVVVLGIIVMPALRVGGMQIFRTESSDNSDKIFGKGLDLARWIAGVFLGLTALCAIVYAALGMSAFDAITHAMATIATGGMSTHDLSFAYFKSPAIEWTGAFFMMAGGLPFVAMIRVLRGRRNALFTDIQVRAYIAFLAVASLIVAANHAWMNDVAFGEAIRLAVFNVVSIVTTTGFVTADYQTWGPFAIGAFFFLTFVGGCSGSTAGGIKIYRIQILWKLAMAHLTRLISPSQVVVLTYGTRRIDDEVAFAVLTFLIVMLISLAVSTLALSAIGLDFVTALSGSATAWANVGPGLGDIIGPAGNFAPLPDAALWILSFMMILGRLEFFTLLVMLTPTFWRG